MIWMKRLKGSSAQMTLQEQYSTGVMNLLQNIKVRKARIVDAVDTMEDSSDPKFLSVKKINQCMIKLLSNLQVSMEQKIKNISSFLS